MERGRKGEVKEGPKKRKEIENGNKPENEKENERTWRGEGD